MPEHAVDIDISDPNTSHAQVIDLIGHDKRVLDVGCSTGELGRVLATRGCRVIGLEVDAAAAAVAEQHLERVVVADVDSTPLSERFEAAGFDVVVFSDVLEHLADPHAALTEAARLLGPNGRIVVSVPNVSHGSVRLALLQDRPDAGPGLLDGDRVRLFTRQRLVDLLAGAGLVLDDLRGTLADPLDAGVALDPHDLPVGAAEWVRGRPDALVRGFQCAARPAGDGEAAVPELVPAVPAAAVPAPAVPAAEALTAESEQAARQALVERDRVVGLEASLATATERIAAMEDELGSLRARDERQKDEIGRLRKRVGALEHDLAAAPRGVAGLLRDVYRKIRR
ncbi:class I SAM-dependent methyltransferase [Nocardioides sp. CER19]|uniref:class I SAM-dependent methyltransferase n=1 Tax=Nocardioides sp. CER19 TaxID=3038538 RepID=UPI00244B4EB4|nr:class I SAM-dependent methyltransferase [Nocardioides sp. CER19]MDH2416913.1 class I SAM-dependent methyltransferase [Nocardioides sp. CER19]